jgi:N-acetylmuramoyl-L-alanine amidase
MKIMAKNWNNDYIGINVHSRSGQKLDKVVGIILHWTGNFGAGDEAHETYFANLEDRYASAHIFADRDSATCIIPLNEVAYQANDVQKRNKDGSRFRPLAKVLGENANLTTVSLEMCVEKDGEIHSDTIKRSIAICAELCQMFKLEANQIYRHHDVTDKNCPAPFVKDPARFESFKKEVDKILHPVKKPVKVKIPTSILKKGSEGKDVKLLQQKLGINDDGKFGEVTESNVIIFQKKHKLKADGIVGKATWTALVTK